MTLEVLAFPYLPVREVVEVGTWTLLPPGAPDEHFVEASYRPFAEGLLRLYAGNGDSRMGVLVAPPSGRIGDEIPRDGMESLRRAVLLGLLEGNPTPPALLNEDEDADPNGGWRSATSDNAALWGHPIDDSGHTAVEYGAMVTVLSGGHNVLQPDLKIRAPVEVPKAFMYAGFDAGYADAVYSVLQGNDEPARRLARTIDWLDLAWRNSPSITPPVRVVLLRTGFEVLFGTDKTFVVRDALSALLDHAEAPRRRRIWDSLAGEEQSSDLSDLAWWFQQFAFLRNAIMHGDALSDDEFDHEGRPHVWLGQQRLRDAIKEIVASAGHPDVLLDRATRERDARVRAMVERLERDADPQENEDL